MLPDTASAINENGNPRTKEASLPLKPLSKNQNSSPDWSTYKGETDSDGKPHGDGKVCFLDGSEYVGQFTKGAIEGAGKLRYPPESSCLWCGGEFVDGKLNGRGIMVLSGGKERYQGEFEKGRMHGKGTFYHANGDITSGEFRNDMVDGLAVRTFPDKSFFSGQFENNHWLGLGTFTFSNGDVYEGNFNQDGANDFGVKQFHTGTRYTGGFRNDKLDGEGILEFENGDVFEGQFKNNMMHGYGQYVYKNGDWCQGNFAEDSMTGKGEFYFANGNTYVGDFFQDEMHGHGLFVWKNSNEKYEGSFVHNKPGSKGKLTFADGSAFKGPFLNGKPHGNGVFCYPMKYGGGEVEIRYENGVREPLEPNKLLQKIALLNSELRQLKQGGKDNTNEAFIKDENVENVQPMEQG